MRHWRFCDYTAPRLKWLALICASIFHVEMSAWQPSGKFPVAMLELLRGNFPGKKINGMRL
jgi:hypothetical protein